MNSVQQIKTPIETPKCTFDLQMTSLCNFMKVLGYSIIRQYNGGVFFENPDNQHQPIVSFRTAVEMHNGKITKNPWCAVGYNTNNTEFWWERFSLSDNWWDKITVQSRVVTDPLSIYVAYKSKVVDRVKLQLNKKTGVVKAQSNVIKWASPAAEATYSKELYY